MFSKLVTRNPKRYTLPMPLKSAERESTGTDIGAKLDIIIEYMERLDRRDKHRTQAHYIRTFLALISTGVFLWSIWYFTVNMDEIMRRMTEQTTRMMMEQSAEGSEAMMEQFRQMFTP